MRLCKCGHNRRDHDKDGGDCTGCLGCVLDTTILDHPYVQCNCREFAEDKERAHA